MTAAELCTGAVQMIAPDASVQEAARRMREHRVGTLVVVNGDAPIEGIVTDRDLVVGVLAADRDPSTTPVAQVMTRGPAAVEAGVSAGQALHEMAAQGVRQLVILGPDGTLTGVVTGDDLLSFLVDGADPAGDLLRRRVRL